MHRLRNLHILTDTQKTRRLRGESGLPRVPFRSPPDPAPPPGDHSQRILSYMYSQTRAATPETRWSKTKATLCQCFQVEDTRPARDKDQLRPGQGVGGGNPWREGERVEPQRTSRHGKKVDPGLGSGRGGSRGGSGSLRATCHHQPRSWRPCGWPAQTTRTLSTSGARRRCGLPAPLPPGSPEARGAPCGRAELQTQLRGALVKRRLLDRWELCCPSAQ